MSVKPFWLRAACLAAALVAALPATSAAQSTPAKCAPENIVGDLGFTGHTCTRCVITGKHIRGRPDIEFGTEPTLWGIKKGGPADGKLEEMDVLVAVDGQLITTQAGAVLYSWLPPGKPVKLTVRRLGILRDIEIVPAAQCRVITVEGLPSSTRGWFGFTLSCASCGLVLKGPEMIAFGSYPEVTEVVPESPAEKAGLKPGDVLVAADGLSLKSLAGTTVFRTVKPYQKVTLRVVRNGEIVTVTVTTGPWR